MGAVLEVRLERRRVVARVERAQRRRELGDADAVEVGVRRRATGHSSIMMDVQNVERRR